MRKLAGDFLIRRASASIFIEHFTHSSKLYGAMVGKSLNMEVFLARMF